jgi:hypothetical protein
MRAGLYALSVEWSTNKYGHRSSVAKCATLKYVFSDGKGLAALLTFKRTCADPSWTITAPAAQGEDRRRVQRDSFIHTRSM